MFFVVKGSMRIELRDGIINLKQGEFCVIPKGIEHKPVADEEAHIMLFEPKSTEQTGGIESELLVESQPWI
jgi:mannose-6-phosphate isomerase-like protein (cupin superfamily)